LLLLLTNVLPLSIRAHWSRGGSEPLVISSKEDGACVTLSVSGDAIEAHSRQAIVAFRDAISLNKPVIVNLSQTTSVDPRFFGILLMLRKQLSEQGKKLTFEGAPPKIRKVFRLNRFGYLLSN
jgi:N-acetylglucosaminyldiphosphoundecaprenol N-acetyl-beta-D-mannosaminyltransferase